MLCSKIVGSQGSAPAPTSGPTLIWRAYIQTSDPAAGLGEKREIGEEK